MARKKTPTEKCGANTRTGGTCKKTAGWGTNHVGIGTCKLHGGNTPNHVKSARRRLAAVADTSAVLMEAYVASLAAQVKEHYEQYGHDVPLPPDLAAQIADAGTRGIMDSGLDRAGYGRNISVTEGVRPEDLLADLDALEDEVLQEALDAIPDA